MLVIADSSPLIVLINIAHVDVLPALFGQVIIPPQVAGELSQSNRPQAIQNFIVNPPAWLRVQAPISIESIPLLQSGEAAAISLAKQLNADLLLIDETRGRKAAAQRKIRLTGTIGVLELAATQGLLNLQQAFEKIKQSDFWISHELLDERLNLFMKTQKPK
jgi:predicted nucleic acid-binding protein